MPLTRQQKEQRVQSTQERLASATSIVFVAYDGLTVGEMTELRSQLAESGGKLRVMPKRLLRIVLKNLALDFDMLIAVGQLAVAWGSDHIAPAKILSHFAKAHEGKLRLLAGTLEGNMLTFEEVTTLAALPTREIMLSQLFSVMNGPVRSFTVLLAAIPSGFVRALHAIASQRAEK